MQDQRTYIVSDAAEIRSIRLFSSLGGAAASVQMQQRSPAVLAFSSGSTGRKASSFIAMQVKISTCHAETLIIPRVQMSLLSPLKF